jgi:hypothetical protein
MQFINTEGQEIDVKTEMVRHKGQRTTMLEKFKQMGSLTTADLMRIGTGCSSRVKELRREGHIIVAIYERPGMWRYVYKGQKNE